MDKTLIERYESGADALHAVLAGLTDADLDAHPVPGTWSIREIVLHLMDSDLIASYRMKRVIAMDEPTLQPYDETLFNQRLMYQRLDANRAAEVFRLNRLLTASMLRLLPEEAFRRTGMHEETGLHTLTDLIRIYADHLDHHLKFARNKRTMLGKPMG